MGDLLKELKRRNIFKVGVAYAVVAWLVLQIGSLFASAFSFPPLVMHIVIFFVVLSFPIAMFFAWAFELTPDGLRRSESITPGESVSSQTGRKLDFLIMGVMALVITILLVDRLFIDNDTVEDKQVAEVSLDGRSYDSIAVLPFVNMSGDPTQSFFSDGISEELLNLLARTKGLRVAARTSSFAFRDQNVDITGIGEKLNVGTILEGSVRKADKRLRITAQLIDVESGYHLWSETYDRELTDVFDIQDEISAAIVTALAVHFSGEVQVAATSQGGNVEAYEVYLKGRELLGTRTTQSIEQAALHFDKAIEIDPNFAPAYAGKAETYLLMSDAPGAYGDIPQKYAFEFASTFIDQALKLDAELAEAYSSRGFIMDKLGRYEEALENYNKALELRPNFAIALMWKALALSNTNRWKDAREAHEKAHRVDPMSMVIMYNLALFRSYYGDVEGVDELADRAEALGPENAHRVTRVRAFAREIEQDFSEAYRLRSQTFADRPVPDNRIGFAQTAFDLKNLNEAIFNTTPEKTIGYLLSSGEIDRARQTFDEMDLSWQNSETGVWSLVNIEMWADNFAEANRVLDTSLPDLDLSAEGPLFIDSFEVFAQVVPYIRIKNEVMDAENTLRALTSLEAYFRSCQKSKIDFSCHMLDAALKTFHGDLDGAVQAVDKSLQSHNLTWDARRSPVFDALADREDFQALFDAFDVHINKERAELGWEPIE